MDGLKHWIFHPGMRFQASDKWWGDQGRRAAPHEGLDLYSFADAAGRVKTVDQHTQIPAAFAGQHRQNRPGFSGKIHLYEPCNLYGRRPAAFVGLWTHRSPGFSENRPEVAEGEIIAAISGFPGKKTNLPPHVHLTFAWVPVDGFSANSAYLEKSGPMIPR